MGKALKPSNNPGIFVECPDTSTLFVRGELRRARLRTEVRGQVHYVKSSNSKTPAMLVLLRLSLRSRIKHRHDSSLNDVPKSVDDHSP